MYMDLLVPRVRKSYKNFSKHQYLKYFSRVFQIFIYILKSNYQFFERKTITKAGDWITHEYSKHSKSSENIPENNQPILNFFATLLTKKKKKKKVKSLIKRTKNTEAMMIDLEHTYACF